MASFMRRRGRVLPKQPLRARSERRSALLSSGARAGVSAFELAPDWACEVLSASTHNVDRGEKLPIYAREKVGHVRLVDPLEHYLEVLRLDGET